MAGLLTRALTRAVLSDHSHGGATDVASSHAANFKVETHFLLRVLF